MQTERKLSNSRPQLVSGEFYHVVMRGVGEEPIFRDQNDHYRGIFSFYEFNTSSPVVMKERRLRRKDIKKANAIVADTRDLLVEICAFCLMPNHIHLLLCQRQEGGISKFIQKLGTGYAIYFNRKYERRGHLFQGKFHAVYIENDNQLKNVFVYIHTNPAALVNPNWKKKGIENPGKTIAFLENYKWSSYRDYLGDKNFPSVTSRDFLLEIMGGFEGSRKFIDHWIRYKGELWNGD